MTTTAAQSLKDRLALRPSAPAIANPPMPSNPIPAAAMADPPPAGLLRTPSAPPLGTPAPLPAATPAPAAPAAPSAVAAAPTVATPSLMSRIGGGAARGLGVVGGALGTVSAGRDIAENGLNVNNGVNMGTSLAGLGGSFVAPPVAVGAGALSVGKALGSRLTPDSVAMGLGATAESLASPRETYDRMQAGGPFIKPGINTTIAGPNMDPQRLAEANARNLGDRAAASPVPALANLGKGMPTTPGQTQAMGDIATPAAPAGPLIESLDPRSLRGRQASHNLDNRGYVPESGTGIMRNNSTGAITQFSGGQPEAPASRATLERAYATSPTLDANHLPPSLQRDIPSALSTFQRALKTGTFSDIAAARAGLHQENADKAQTGLNDRLDKTINGENMRTGATLAQGARLAGLTARQKQLQDDREFGLKQQDSLYKGQELGIKREDLGLRRDEMGAKRNTEDFAQREATEKNLTSRFESQFKTLDAKGNQVVDQARVAQAKMGVQTFLGNKIKELTDIVASGKGTKEHEQMLDLLKRKGPAALDDEDLTAIQQNTERGARVKQTQALVGGSNYIESNDPNAYGIRSRKQNLFGSDTLTLNNGSTVRENDLKYTEPGNTFLPNVLKTETDNFGLRRNRKEK